MRQSESAQSRMKWLRLYSRLHVPRKSHPGTPGVPGALRLGEHCSSILGKSTETAKEIMMGCI